MPIKMRKHPLVMFLALAMLLGPIARLQAAEVLDRIVAVVNDDVVLQSELNHELSIVRRQLQQQNMQLPDPQDLQRQVLEQLILQKLQLDAATRAGISVDDATLDEAVRRVAEENHMNLSQFRDALAAESISWTDFRTQLRNQIIISRLRHQVMQSRITVTPQEIDQLVEQQRREQPLEYHLANILVALPDAASPQVIARARAKAEHIHQMLEQNANFQTLAASYSDSQTALQGGDLGWRKQGELPTLIGDQINQMKVGQITPVLRSPSGFHIFKLLARREGKRHIVTQTHVRHILIETNAVVSDQDARMRLESLRKRIENGASFAALAKANSDDPTSAAQGGDLGWIDPGRMVDSFEQVMNSLQPGEISQPFRTRFGWHIVQVLGRREQDMTDAYLREQAAQQIQNRKLQDETQLWLRQLREEAYVDIRL
ncbi:MAG TPA: peptidylprolyl isomerase [Nitrococcus sp.]|nr:peptidylprolyl isomerase [Nitrococcus sp.]